MVVSSKFLGAVFGSALVLASFGARADLLSPGDKQAYRVAFVAARSGDWNSAWRNAGAARDQTLAKVLRWLEITRGNGFRFSEIVEFADQNPDWPQQSLMRQRAEEAISGVPDGVLRRYFDKNKPVTPFAKLRLAEILYDEGKREQAYAIARDVWINADLTASEEKSILARYQGAGVIRSEEHIKRLDRLVWDGQDDAAKRQMARVSPEWRALADARLRMARMEPGIERLIAKIPASLQKDPGLLFERARWRRRKELHDAALEILQNPPKELGRPSAWWGERQILARRLLSDGNAQAAYKLVSRHGLGDGAAFAEAEFLSGWIALRWLKDGKAGYEHFVRLYEKVKLPISQSRGAYWAGRAAEASKMQSLATNWYLSASEHPTTYYGQLATARLGPEAPPKLVPEPHPSAEERAAFDKKELVRAARMMTEIGEGDRVKPFMLRLSELSKTPSDHALVAILAEQLGRTDLAVAISKRAGYAGVPLVNHGYPIIDLDRKGLAERPLVLAMTRQESAFERDAVSKAGARGLMQLMPGTAKDLAKSMSMPFNAERLLTDPTYNLTLGRAYLDGLLDNFGGSYILSVAAYNAGPGRVRQWMREYGDPRTRDIDSVDWVESIPFPETRNYVQRVLENLQVYRLRLGDTKLAFSLLQDLKR
jgi:soluble lytic murein transglycosylase